MNDTQIFCKTAEGERALVQRTRLVQRNLRNVLILVDGYATVSDLTVKLRDRTFVEASLTELRRGGFIEAIEEYRARGDAESADIAATPPSIADELDASASATMTMPVPRATPAVGEVVSIEPPELPPQLDSVFAAPPEQPEISNPSIEAQMPEVVAEISPPAYIERSRVEPAWRGMLARLLAQREKPKVGDKGEDKAKASSVATDPPLAKSSTATVRTLAVPKVLRVRIKPVRRGQASQAKSAWAMRLLAVTLFVLCFAVIALLIYPYDRHREDLERLASDWVGLPVTTSNVRLVFSPLPALSLEQLRIGNAPGVVLGNLHVLPDPVSLFGDQWRLARAVLEKPLIDGSAIQALFVSRVLPSSGHLRVDSLQIANATVSLPGLSLDNVSGVIDVQGVGRVKSIRLHTSDNALRIDAVPRGETWQLKIMAQKWAFPIAGKPSGLLLSSLEANGDLRVGSLAIDQLEAHLLDGVVKGSAQIAWSQGVALNTALAYTRLNSARLAALVEPRLDIEGEAEGKLVLYSRASSLEDLFRNLRGGGPFSLDKAAVRRFDLVEAVRSQSDAPIRGGETRFETLSGSVEVDSDGWRLGNLRATSGAMNATGSLANVNDHLRGLIEVQLRGSAGLVRSPVAIDGSLADPLLRSKRVVTFPMVEPLPAVEEAR